MRRLIASALLAALFCGCGGGRFRVAATGCANPVSASGAVFGPQGERLLVPEDLEIVRQFQLELWQWSMLWSMLPLNGREFDLSEALTEEIRAAGGEAIVNLEVTLHVNLLRDMIGWTAVVPTAMTATVRGDVVRRRSPDDR